MNDSESELDSDADRRMEANAVDPSVSISVDEIFEVDCNNNDDNNDDESPGQNKEDVEGKVDDNEENYNARHVRRWRRTKRRGSQDDVHGIIVSAEADNVEGEMDNSEEVASRVWQAEASNTLVEPTTHEAKASTNSVRSQHSQTSQRSNQSLKSRSFKDLYARKVHKSIAEPGPDKDPNLNITSSEIIDSAWSDWGQERTESDAAILAAKTGSTSSTSPSPTREIAGDESATNEEETPAESGARPKRRVTTRKSAEDKNVVVEGRSFHRVVQMGDGNCLFRSLVYVLKVAGIAAPRRHGDLRQEVVDHALANWQRFGVLAKKQHELRNKKDYEETMRTDTTWGDHSEVIVAADLYQVPIRVFGSNSGLVLSENPYGSQRAPVYIRYDSGTQHYDALEPVDDSEGVAVTTKEAKEEELDMVGNNDDADMNSS